MAFEYVNHSENVDIYSNKPWYISDRNGTLQAAVYSSCVHLLNGPLPCLLPDQYVPGGFHQVVLMVEMDLDRVTKPTSSSRCHTLSHRPIVHSINFPHWFICNI